MYMYMHIRTGLNGIINELKNFRPYSKDQKELQHRPYLPKYQLIQLRSTQVQ